MSNEKTLGISGIAIKPERLRSLQPAKVAELAASMAKLGQLNQSSCSQSAKPAVAMATG
jgi:hypothetical protein